MIARLFCRLGLHRYIWTDCGPNLRILVCARCGRKKLLEYLLRVKDPVLRAALAKQLGPPMAYSVGHRSEEDLYR